MQDSITASIEHNDLESFENLCQTHYFDNNLIAAIVIHGKIEYMERLVDYTISSNKLFDVIGVWMYLEMDDWKVLFECLVSMLDRKTFAKISREILCRLPKNKEEHLINHPKCLPIAEIFAEAEPEELSLSDNMIRIIFEDCCDKTIQRKVFDYFVIFNHTDDMKNIIDKYGHLIDRTLDVGYILEKIFKDEECFDSIDTLVGFSEMVKLLHENNFSFKNVYKYDNMLALSTMFNIFRIWE